MDQSDLSGMGGLERLYRTRVAARPVLARIAELQPRHPVGVVPVDAEVRVVPRRVDDVRDVRRVAIDLCGAEELGRGRAGGA